MLPCLITWLVLTTTVTGFVLAIYDLYDTPKNIDAGTKHILYKIIRMPFMHTLLY